MIVVMRCSILSTLTSYIIILTTTVLVVNSQQHSRCYDEGGATACYYWQLSGMCREAGYRDHMFSMCRKTCNLCPNIFVRPYVIPTKKVPYKACRDTQKGCAGWKKYCKPGNDYYAFMMKNCPRICFKCADPECKDVNVKCPRYHKYGYCKSDHKYFNYMTKNCAVTCDFCTADLNNISKSIPTVRPLVKKAFECDFEEHECDWLNQVFGDFGDWQSGVNEHGPAQGYNGSAKYLYVNTPHPGYKTILVLPWQLVLPDGRKSLGTLCFHFMHQISHGRLSVFEVENPSLAHNQPNPQTLFESIDYVQKWTEVKLNVRADPQFSLRVVAQKGVRDSFIVVDHFYFTEGKCS